MNFTINQDLKAICPSKELYPRFLAYFMRAAEGEILAAVSRGVTVHRLSTDVLKSLAVPLPPMEEQKRSLRCSIRRSPPSTAPAPMPRPIWPMRQALLENGVNEVFTGLAAVAPILSLSDAVHPDCKLCSASFNRAMGWTGAFE